MEGLTLKYVRYSFLLILLIHHCVGPPTKTQPVDNKNSSETQGNVEDEFAVEYNRYLKEVVDTLETDPLFVKKLHAAKEEDFRSGKIAAELEFVNHKIRTKLDELKRTELQRLRELMQLADDEKRKESSWKDTHGHLDHMNPHTFEVVDLKKLMAKVRHDLEEADKKRKENFKEYELQKEFEKEQKLKTLDEEHKKAYLNELEQQKKKHQEHDPIHHPGSKAQLEEVWEKADHMENVKFDTKAFFYLHDIDGNGYWDEQEVNALFLKELDKVYQAGAPEDDMREREEEMERMREHVFKEVDTNQDRLISYEELVEESKKREFQEDTGWETLDKEPQFTREEYLEFERHRQEDIQQKIQQGLLQPYPPGMQPIEYYHPQQMPPDQGHPQMSNMPQYHHPNQIPQYQNQMGHHPNQMGQHPNQMGQHPNQMGQHPNQMGQHPGQMGQHPGQMGQHPGQMGQHPNQMGQHPNQMGQHPGQMGQHPNQVGQHPNQVGQQHPNSMGHQQVPQHLNQQYPNQVPHNDQISQHSNQVPQNPNHISETPHQSNEIKHQQNQAQQQMPDQHHNANAGQPAINQVPQYQQNNQGQYQQPNQGQYAQLNQPQQNIPQSNNIPTHNQIPQQQQQQQYQAVNNNNIPQRQYQKYEPHSKAASNEKNEHKTN